MAAIYHGSMSLSLFGYPSHNIIYQQEDKGTQTADTGTGRVHELERYQQAPENLLGAIIRLVPEQSLCALFETTK